MCGFSAYYGKMPDDFIKDGFSARYRGPDNSQFKEVDEKVGLLFHRLAIVGLGRDGDQPLNIGNVWLVCNGEIYNHKELFEENGFTNHSGSDCEIIIHLYKRYGMKSALKMLDGVFAFFLYDSESDEAFVARDPFGVRPAFYGMDKDSFAVASEAKALQNSFTRIWHVVPGTFISTKDPGTQTYYYEIDSQLNLSSNSKFKKSSEKELLREIRWRLTKAVEKRLMSEREIGCLLSGGLDSSLIASLVSHMSRGNRLIRGKDSDEWQHFSELELPYKLKTFSIGMEGSPDLDFADKVADWIDSDHHRVQLTEEDFLSAVHQTIWVTESYDTTTVRASVGNYLVSKYVSENTDCKVIFNGDGSDEVCCGYVYNAKAPSDEALQEEALRLVKEIYLFDVLRSDRSISSNGLEARTPFLDKAFVELYLSIDPSLKSFDKKDRIEKDLLRRAFESDGLLPDEILWRHKCAFSDGVSSAKKSWHKTLQAEIEELYSDESFEEMRSMIKNCRPDLKESLHYRQIHVKLFSPSMNQIIPHFWLPRWTNVKDPSARELDSHIE